EIWKWLKYAGAYGIRKLSDGNVKTTPPATDSQADRIVLTMLFSRMVDPPSRLSTDIARTAIGMDALTVRPARRPRYTVDAPNSRPKRDPMMMALIVNSAGDCDGDTYGLNARGIDDDPDDVSGGVSAIAPECSSAL